MCCKVEDSDKAQPALTFPDGWSFVFTHRELLIVAATNNRRYRAVQPAMNQNPTALKNVDPTAFYMHVGLDPAVHASELKGLALPSANDTDDRKRPGISSKLDVGSRCYSKYGNGQWYWGVIKEVSGTGKYARYSVVYDDGDTIGDVPWTDICSERQYKDDFNEDPQPPPDSEDQHFDAIGTPPTKRQKTGVGHESERIAGKEKFVLSLRDLRLHRCKNCVMCSKEDCGICKPCQHNKGETSTYKQVCLLKVS
jgi:hypothetical protein